MQVAKIYLSVDVLPETVTEAIEWGADFFLAHHPLYLFELAEPEPGEEPTPVAPWKRELENTLNSAGMTLFTAHTNADIANPGVNDALAEALGLINVVPMPERLGRVGELVCPVPLQKFIEQIARSIPVGVNGVRGTGDSQQLMKKVALCGGSGGDRIEIARELGVDAYLTADLKHHRVTEALAAGAPVLIDGGHFATEWPWLAQAARLLAEDLRAGGYAQPEMKISEISTDPWRVR
jgi:dinuclear metal center YbgI/SA1388 family protein